MSIHEKVIDENWVNINLDENCNQVTYLRDILSVVPLEKISRAVLFYDDQGLSVLFPRED